MLPVLFAFLAYSIAAPLVLAFIADLQLKAARTGPSRR